jgi:hypothetical protein
MALHQSKKDHIQYYHRNEKRKTWTGHTFCLYNDKLLKYSHSVIQKSQTNILVAIFLPV